MYTPKNSIDPEEPDVDQSDETANEEAARWNVNKDLRAPEAQLNLNDHSLPNYVGVNT